MTELDGYTLDVEFDAIFARETMPSWLSMALLLAGRPPLHLDRPALAAKTGLVDHLRLPAQNAQVLLHAPPAQEKEATLGGGDGVRINLGLAQWFQDCGHRPGFGDHHRGLRHWGVARRDRMVAADQAVRGPG